MPDADLRDRIARGHRVVRRSVLGRRRSLAFLCAAGAVLAALRVVAPPEPELVDLLVAAHDLPAGEVVDAQDVAVRRVPPDLLPDGSVALSEVLDRTVAAPLRRGEPFTDVRVVSGSLLDGYPGLVAAPVRIPDSGTVGLLAVGDRVDILAADPAGRLPADVVAARAVVIALPRDDPDAPIAAAAGALGGRLVVLGVPASTATALAGRAAGGLLTLVLSR